MIKNASLVRRGTRPVDCRLSTVDSSSRRGQAIAELTICLVTLVVLILGVTLLARLSLKRLTLRREVRLEAGTAALGRSTAGWVDDVRLPENRANAFHQLNAYAHLERFAPALPSRLPTSLYTLAARDLPESELGLATARREERIPLDPAISTFLYPKATILLREELTFPALSRLTP
ncbi:MAG: hypothetical protein ACI4RT_00235 [Candidatus Spyradenecus sp.]